ncbi:MAG: PQQ-like beta-propeller repeat protein [Crenarchaeota archaeon]|nr:PQQ-like beta-propeller repeat protein [Thermoproteota archaeon]
MSKKIKSKYFLIASILIILVILPSILTTITAQSTGYKTKTTYPVIGAMPNPIGVGQETLIWLGISDSLAFQSDGWAGLTVLVMKPDGTNDTLGPFRTDSTGGTGTVYIPDQVGNYTLQTHFPGQWYNWTSGTVDTARKGDFWYEESLTSPYTLVVTEQPVQYYPGVPLPSEYWSRPIDAQSREWSSIAGNWLKGTNGMAQYHPDNNAPETAHILWAKSLTYGGLSGSYGSVAYELGDAYEGKFFGSVIIDGILFYNRDRTTGGSTTEQQVVAEDLHLGTELWARTLGNNERLAFGQMLYWDTYNMHGVFPYIWTTTGTTWKAYDAYTGRLIYTMTDVPSDANVYGPTYGPHGEILRLTVNLNSGWMSLWNSSNIPQLYGNTQYVLPTEYFYGSWRPEGKTVNASTTGYMWNVTIPEVPTAPDVAITRTVLVLEDRIVGSNVAWDKLRTDSDPVVMWAISTKDGQEGILLFNRTWNAPSGDLTFALGPISLDDGVFTVSAKETRQYYGFNIDTGEQIWGPSKASPYLDMYTIQHSSWARELVANGTLFTAGYAGTLNAYDIKTGQHLWSYDAADIYSEILWSNSWPMQILLAADGKIYYSHAEHSPVNPYPRGSPFICLNMSTGKEIWRIDGAFRGSWSGGDSIIGDSIIATYDTYDGQIYAIGKGPTEMSVTVDPVSIDTGKSIVIRGDIKDISPGTQSEDMKLRFPKGVPVISDASMSSWMLYAYKQFAKPTNATGVTIILSVVDSNGNYREIGSTTSDADGFFNYKWLPDIDGQYQLYASFTGSAAFYPCHAVTSFNVEPTTSTPIPTQELISTAADNYLLLGIIAIIIAIAIVGALLALLVTRKRP